MVHVKKHNHWFIQRSRTKAIVAVCGSLAQPALPLDVSLDSAAHTVLPLTRIIRFDTCKQTARVCVAYARSRETQCPKEQNRIQPHGLYMYIYCYGVSGKWNINTGVEWKHIAFHNKHHNHEGCCRGGLHHCKLGRLRRNGLQS